MPPLTPMGPIGTTPIGPSLNPDSGSIARPVKLPHALVITRLERAGIAAQAALSESLRTQTVFLYAQDGANTGASNPNDREGRGWNLPPNFCTVYVCSIGTGRDCPPLPPFLVS